ncbi:hypothetical protein ACLKA7_016868 [Drosophila subpalustris]
MKQDAEAEQPIADLPANTEVNAITYPENESLANEPVLVDSEKTSGELLLQECVGECEVQQSYTALAEDENDIHHSLSAPEEPRSVSELNIVSSDVFLANFMGHHKDIHKNIYRVTTPISEITEVSKMLLAASNIEKTEVCRSNQTPNCNEITTTANNLDENLANTTDDNESENDVDFNDSVKNTSSKKRRSTSPFGKTRRVRWTIEEKQEMIDIFGDLKSLQKLPSLQECLQIIRNSKNLRERTPAQLKTWLDNQRKSESRKLK